METILNYFGIPASSSFSINIILLLSIIFLELFLRLKKTQRPQSIIYFIIFILMSLVGALLIIAQASDKVLPQKIKNKID